MKITYYGIETVSGKRVGGSLDAISLGEAVSILKERRIEVISLSPLVQKTSSNVKVTRTELSVVLQELSTLLLSGVSVAESLKAMTSERGNPTISYGFLKILQKVEGGMSFSEALKASSFQFEPYVYTLVEAGEANGELAHALKSSSDQMNADLELRSNIQSALAYPAFLLLAGFAAILIIFISVVPKFSHLLSTDKEMPLLAEMVLGAGMSFNENKWLFFISIILGLFCLVLGMRSQKVRSAIVNNALRAPLIGHWLEEQDVARWSSLTSFLLKTKVNIVSALKISSNYSSYESRRKRAYAIVLDLESGMHFSDALERANLVPETSLNLVRVGEKSGRLAEMLAAVSELHAKSSKRKMQKIIVLIEPLAIIVIGVTLGILIIGVIMAITASTDVAL